MQIKKSPVHFSNGVTRSGRNATMAYNVQREKSRKRTLTTVVCFMPVRKVKTSRAVTLSGKIKKQTKARSNHFQLCILATLLRTAIGSRKPAKSSEVVTKIATKLTKNTCLLKPTKKTCKTGYANYKLLNKHWYKSRQY